MPDHTIKQGEHISTLADLYRFYDYHTIWDDAANADLKAKRDNPNVLFPGDVVHVPDKQKKTLDVSTTKLHTFAIKTQHPKLRIVIKDYFDKPLANTPCALEVEGAPKALTTDNKGLIERDIDRPAKKGRLVVRGSDIEVRIGHLDPVEEKSGQVARLNNLGYRAGLIEAPDDQLFQSALEEFQCDNDIRDGSGRVTGVADARTRAKLKENHGC